VSAHKCSMTVGTDKDITSLSEDGQISVQRSA
jgi:hypothetical protein